MADLLIELFSEEIPARMQRDAGAHLEKAMCDALKAAGLSFDAAANYTTPRRLALTVSGIPISTPDISEERRGPRVDAPEKALEGFMRGAGVTRDQLEEREEKKGTFFYAKIEKPGKPTADVIADALEACIRNFPWPKQQRWGAGSLRWVRPLHSIICLFDGTVVNMDVDGIKAGNTTEGHRFMARDAFTVTDFADYKAKLEAAKVMLDPADRMALIAAEAGKLAEAKGLTFVEDKGLLAEVSGLIEWPVPLMGDFDPAFLNVPEEVLILTMKKDQKYFVCRDCEGKLAPHFITISNLIAADGGTAVAQGNARVITARLADARFFWEQDLKRKLDDLLPNLNEIIFHIELGKVSDRVARMKALADDFAKSIDNCDRSDACRAAELSKADLTSNMVNEFASLQGVMGRYYALEQGESAAVADAVRDHYAPAGPNDDCPSAPVSVAVAAAEKLDTLVGFFGIDQKPTGSKDPYALRRAALGIIRLITENGVRLSLREFADKAGQLFVNQGVELVDVKEDLLAFFADRLKVQQRDKGVRHDLIDAVFAKGDDDLVRILARVDALGEFVGSDDGANLLAGYKRAANILKIEEKKDGKAYADAPDASLFADPSERALADALVSAKADAEKALAGEDFTGAMAALSKLRVPVDAFFDDVMVNADDASVRANRLNLLSSIRAAVDTVADFSLIEG